MPRELEALCVWHVCDNLTALEAEDDPTCETCQRQLAVRTCAGCDLDFLDYRSDDVGELIAPPYAGLAARRCVECEEDRQLKEGGTL